MKNELENFTATKAPSTLVSQTGEKNLYIDHAENVTQNIIFPATFLPPQAGLLAKPRTRQVNQNCYNLFVIGGDSFDQHYYHFLISSEKSLSYYWSTEELRNHYASLSAEAIAAIKTFPSLFMPEADHYKAKAGAEQYALFGFVDDVRIQNNGIKIKCQLIWPIPLQQISDIGLKLGLKDMDKAITEMNDSHWAIKGINLIEQLTDANISLMGLNQ